MGCELLTHNQLRSALAGALSFGQNFCSHTQAQTWPEELCHSTWCSPAPLRKLTATLISKLIRVILSSSILCPWNYIKTLPFHSHFCEWSPRRHIPVEFILPKGLMGRHPSCHRHGRWGDGGYERWGGGGLAEKCERRYTQYEKLWTATECQGKLWSANGRKHPASLPLFARVCLLACCWKNYGLPFTLFSLCLSFRCV